MKEQGLLDAYSKLGDFEKYNQEMVETMKPIIQATGLAKGEYAEQESADYVKKDVKENK